jgi:hypothetical protein
VKADSLRSRKAVARFGKGARHPLSQSLLGVLEANLLWLVYAPDLATIQKNVRDWKRLRFEARALIKQLRKERKPQEATAVSATLRKINKCLQQAEALEECCSKGIAAIRTIRWAAQMRFEYEQQASLSAGDEGAFTDLEQVWKRWNAIDNAVNYRSLAILDTLQDKALKTAWGKGGEEGALAGYLEAARGGDRALGDGAWPELTLKEIHSRLVAAKAFLSVKGNDEEGMNRQLDEARRLAKALGIKLMPAQRGRKLKTKPC